MVLSGTAFNYVAFLDGKRMLAIHGMRITRRAQSRYRASSRLRAGAALVARRTALPQGNPPITCGYD
jgi:hypothetical protein